MREGRFHGGRYWFGGVGVFLHGTCIGRRRERTVAEGARAALRLPPDREVGDNVLSGWQVGPADQSPSESNILRFCVMHMG